MKILSIQVGTPKTIVHDGKSLITGIFKKPIDGSVLLKKLGLEGDGQADLKVHGGFDKALYAYSHDAYADWKKLRPQDDFSYGALGENLCVDQMSEDSTYIGDVFSIGDAIVQVSQPRYPCHKLGIKFNDLKIIKQFAESGRPGVYFRVLNEGRIEAGDSLKLESRETVLISVNELLNFSSDHGLSEERVQEMLTVQSLPDAWKLKIKARLQSFATQAC